MMEDKRKEELNERIDEINYLESTIDVSKGTAANATNMLEFLRFFKCHYVTLTGCSDNEGYKEDVHIDLSDKEVEEVQGLIEKGLRSRIEKCNDRISKAYQELDKLLK